MTSKKFDIYFAFALLSSLFIVVMSFNCRDSPNDYRCRFSFRTPYRFHANYNTSAIEFPGCEAKKMWIFTRHGTRFPITNTSLGAATILPKIQKSVLKLCKVNCSYTKDQLKHLEEWTSEILNSTPELTVAEEGVNELTDLARRFQLRFPKLLPKNYSHDVYRFVAGKNQRTALSAESFTAGLFGRDHIKDVIFSIVGHKDPVMKVYKGCRKWVEEIENSFQVRRDLEILKNSKLIKTMLKHLSHRLGYKIDYDTALLMETTCAIETALNIIKVSPWCELLTDEELEIMEFVWDFHWYWTKGYGYPLTYEQACSAMINMFDFLSSNDTIKSQVYFAHSSTVLKILALLGLAKDEKPLNIHDYHESAKRLWRLSLIDPFAANLAFISYDCEHESELSILFLHLERIVTLPGCPKNKPCPLSIMKKQYPDNDEECPFDEMCNNY